jgi:hypothetical protein
MKTLSSILFASVLALSTSVFAQGHEHHGGAAPAPEVSAQAQNLPEIDPAASDKGGCGKCKKKGMGGDHQGHGGGMGGCEKCRKGGMGGGHMGHGDGGCPKAAALEDRIDELEKRLDLMQMLMMRGYR